MLLVVVAEAAVVAVVQKVAASGCGLWRCRVRAYVCTVTLPPEMSERVVDATTITLSQLMIMLCLAW